jgi:hypothetical protein
MGRLAFDFLNQQIHQVAIKARISLGDWAIRTVITKAS